MLTTTLMKDKIRSLPWFGICCPLPHCHQQPHLWSHSPRRACHPLLRNLWQLQHHHCRVSPWHHQYVSIISFNSIFIPFHYSIMKYSKNTFLKVIFWARSIPFPEGPECLLNATVKATGNAWVSNGATNQQYTLTVENIGESVVTGAQVVINIPSSASIVSSWNIAHVSGNVYTVSIPSGT